MDNRKNIAIFGFGKEGISAANYFGSMANLSIIDDKSQDEIPKENFKKLKTKNARFYFGKIFPKDEKFDMLVRSPGFRPDHPKITRFTSQGFQLTSPTNIFFENCPGTIIGVTGTKGKGTTSALIYEFLKTQNANAFLAGNIGDPMLEILPKIKTNNLVVLELSSFQLMDLKTSPHVAVVLMITSEHLNWHKDQNEYVKSKESIVSYQTQKDFAIINHDFEQSKLYAQKTKGKVYYFSTQNKAGGVYTKDGIIYSQIGKLEKLCQTKQILLPGQHNLQNVCASVAVAKILKIQNSNIVKVLTVFRGLTHRLELISEIAGVKYYNDSYSTIPETSIAAISAFKEPKILILGGSSKNSNFKQLAETIVMSKSIKALILIGKEAGTIKRAVITHGRFHNQIIENLKSMEQIVKTAQKIARRRDIVLLSPACASFDMFKNYEDRGQQFISEVNKLK